MSKYNEFEQFMNSVINEANGKCKRRYGKSLAEAYNVKGSIFEMIQTVISKGWWVFIALVALLVLGPISFGVAIATFCATPVGMIVVTSLAVFGGVGAIRELYRNRVLPRAVKDIGEKYKSDFESHKDMTYYIDSLIDKASNDLITSATGLK